MNEQMKAMLAQYKDQIKEEHLQQIEAGEYPFDHFDNEEVLKIGLHIVETSKKYGEEIIVMIFREADQAVVFQYIMNAKKPHNLTYAEMKRNAALHCQHSSLWAGISLALGHSLPEVEDDENHCLPVGGAYPVIVNGEHTYTIAVSGLHHGNDGPLLMEAVASWLNKEAPVYTGPLF